MRSFRGNTGHRSRGVALTLGGSWPPHHRAGLPRILPSCRSYYARTHRLRTTVKSGKRNAIFNVSPTCLPNGQGSARCLAFRRTNPAFEPSLYQRQSPPSENAILRGRDKIRTQPGRRTAAENVKCSILPRTDPAFEPSLCQDPFRLPGSLWRSAFNE